MKNMRQLMNLMESVVSVPEAGTWNARTPPTVARPDPTIEAIKARAQEQSKGGYGVHVNRDKRNGNVYISDWYDSDETIASYSNGREVASYSEELEMAPQGSESDMQTASTAAVNSADAGFDQAQGQATEEAKDYNSWRNYTVTTTTGKHVVYGPLDKDEMQAHLSSQYGGSGARMYGEVLNIEPYDGPVDTGRDEKSARSYWDESIAEETGGDTNERHYREGFAFGQGVKNGQNAKLNDMEAAKYSPAFIKGYQAGRGVSEAAPPGMEDVVMDLKDQYPNDHSKAFATAWSIYNKKHGKTDESVPAVKSCQQSNPASADVACAMEDNMSDYDNNFIGSAIKGLYQFATSEDELKSMVAGETGYGSNPEFDSVFSSELAKFLNSGPDSEFGPEFGGSQFEEDATMPLTAAIKKLKALAFNQGHSDGEMSAETGNVSMSGKEAAVDLWYSYRDDAGLPPSEEAFDDSTADEMEQAYEAGFRQGYGGLAEAFDMQNGYNDVEHAEGKDYFPNGADGPVVTDVGPSGAKQGDNPEQKKMQVAETHKELVYAYRKFLKESAS